MSNGTKQLAAALLAVSAAVVGGWATVAPRSFYTSFPLPGHHWVAALPPYNEHLVRDVGGLYLALCVVSVWAAVRPRDETLAVAGLAWLVFGVLHLAFHAAHLDQLATRDAVGNVVSLGAVVVLAAVLVVPGRRRRATAPPATAALSR